MQMTLEIDGTNYTGFTTGYLKNSLDTVSGSFRFTVSTKDGFSYPIKVGQKARVLINNTPRLTGYVEKVNVTYTSNSHTITIEGRDKTADFQDSTINGNATFQPGLTLKQLTEKTLSLLGITDIKVIDKAKDVSPVTDDGTEAPDEGVLNTLCSAKHAEKAYDFVERYARVKQVLITTDGSGNIVLLRPTKIKSGAAIINTRAIRNSNIGSAEFTFDITERFHEYTASTSASASIFQDVPGAKAPSTQELAHVQSAVSVDPDIRPSRKFTFIASESMTQTDVNNRVKWENNLRRVKSQTYNVTVTGFDYLPGKVWIPDLLVDINDDFCDVKTTLLVVEVEYYYDLDGGAYSKLTLLSEDAYTLKQAIKASKKRSTKIGNIFDMSKINV